MFIETSAKTGYNVKQVSSDSVFRDVELLIEMQAVMSFDRRFIFTLQVPPIG